MITPIMVTSSNQVQMKRFPVLECLGTVGQKSSLNKCH